ncbi:MAG: hypothetical protein JWN28_158 [Candidatus Saccharibacteria bacterium]|nr:hypothetical protein [Candidatus Saccharibacteria bacterium]
MEDQPSNLNSEDVAAKAKALYQEHEDIARSQHNANIASMFASDPETIKITDMITESVRGIQEDHTRAATEFATENLAELQQQAIEEDQTMQDAIEASKVLMQEVEESRQEILGNVMRRPFERAVAERKLDTIVNAYCQAHGISRDKISLDEMYAIKALPEWGDDTKTGFNEGAGIATIKF